MSDLKRDAAIKSVAARGQTYAREIGADYDMSCEATVLDCLDIIAFGQRAPRKWHLWLQVQQGPIPQRLTPLCG